MSSEDEAAEEKAELCCDTASTEKTGLQAGESAGGEADEMDAE